MNFYVSMIDYFLQYSIELTDHCNFLTVYLEPSPKKVMGADINMFKENISNVP